MPLFHVKFWKGILLDIRFLVGRFFSFSLLSMSSHCLLTFIASDDKSTVYLIIVALYMGSCVSLLLQKFLSVFGFGCFCTMMCCDAHHFLLILLEFCSTSWKCVWIFFFKFGEFSVNICLICFRPILFLFPFWCSNLVRMLWLMVFYISETVFNFFFFIIVFLSFLNCIISLSLFFFCLQDQWFFLRQAQNYWWVSLMKL